MLEPYCTIIEVGSNWKCVKRNPLCYDSFIFPYFLGVLVGWFCGFGFLFPWRSAKSKKNSNSELSTWLKVIKRTSGWLERSRGEIKQYRKKKKVKIKISWGGLNRFLHKVSSGRASKIFFSMQNCKKEFLIEGQWKEMN